MCNCKNVSLFYYPYYIPGIGSYKKEMVQEAGFEPILPSAPPSFLEKQRFNSYVR
jgi:ABC-type Fe3+-hydroxamate transport system substrate-binding protein